MNRPAGANLGRLRSFRWRVGDGGVAVASEEPGKNRSFKLWLIDGGYHTLQFTLYGLILGLWH